MTQPGRLSLPEVDQRLSVLTRPQRLFLKRAWAKTERKPFFPNRPEGAAAKVMGRMIEMGYARTVGFGAVLTQAGHDCAVRLAGQGWPNTEKPK